MDELRYPIGKFSQNGPVAEDQLAEWIGQIAELPSHVQKAVAGLSEEQLDTPYRDGGWTVRQVVHHLADSHMNSLIRFKLALTEDQPTIKPYEEQLWAELPDSKTAPIAPSIAMLDSLHERWTMILRGMQPSDFERAFIHPASGAVTLAKATALYAWHGRHHVAHITSLRERSDWA